MTVEDRHITSKKWELGDVSIVHTIVDYHSFGTHTATNDSECVRLHIGLRGDYGFDCRQLKSAFKLTGHHNNILYSDGLDIAVSNKSKRIETFGVNFTTESFIHIAQHGNDPLKRLVEKVVNKDNAILSNEWRPNSFKIHQVINEILHCPFANELRELFLRAKTTELLVLQAELYESATQSRFIKSNADKQKLVEAKEVLAKNIDSPLTISQLSKLVNMNEYKLKRGFKELFGTTVFGYIHLTRMNLAKRLLLSTDMSAKQIAYETGYSSPQHFSKAFKKEFGNTPDRIRNHPDYTS